MTRMSSPSTPPPLRALVIDDEPGARELLLEMLEPHAGITVVGTCDGASTAINGILEARPDVVFLDVQMPDGSGFDVIRAVQDSDDDVPLPFIVFVTAYDAHALQAFETGALDYLLKPFDEQRLASTVTRVTTLARRAGAARPDYDARLASALAPLDARLVRIRRLPMRVGERIHLIPVSMVSWFEAQGKHIRVHVVDGKGNPVDFLLRRTMHVLERQLDPEQFVRVRRYAIVGIDHIRHAEPWSHGEYALTLRDGSRVVTTSGYRPGVQRILRGG